MARLGPERLRAVAFEALPDPAARLVDAVTESQTCRARRVLEICSFITMESFGSKRVWRSFFLWRVGVGAWPCAFISLAKGTRTTRSCVSCSILRLERKISQSVANTMTHYHRSRCPQVWDAGWEQSVRVVPRAVMAAEGTVTMTTFGARIGNPFAQASTSPPVDPTPATRDAAQVMAGERRKTCPKRRNVQCNTNVKELSKALGKEFIQYARSDAPASELEMQ